MSARWARGLACLVLLAGAAPGGSALTLADRGRAATPIAVAAAATPAERRAADELAAILARVSGARFEVVDEDREGAARAAIQVGPTAAVRAAAADLDRLGPEQWRMRCDGRVLLLYGGRPRGTLYAVYHFVEDRLGVRFWTPWEAHVPSRRRLEVGRLDAGGAPAFAYRDVYGIEGPLAWRARRRHNGAFSQLPGSWGGRLDYGPPHHAHTAYVYVPPDEYFDAHPEYFSEIAGLRYGGKGQLCLTEPALVDLVLERLRGYVAESRRASAARGEPPPLLFDISQNDWGRPCRCARCAALSEREGTDAAPWVEFLNRIAERAHAELPEISLDTLAYHHTFRPPRTLRLRDEIVLRWSALHQRNFAAPLEDASNAAALDSLRGWRERVRHLRVWDYALLWGDDGELPFFHVGVLARDLRLYHRLGVEGVFVQLDDPVGTDLWDLKAWLLSRLLEDPALGLHGLVREFTDGYYGPAGPAIRAYLERLERAARAGATRLGFLARPAEFGHLDRGFVVEAQQLFDAAERSVAGDGVLLRRVRHARLGLDRAVLTRWSALATEDPRRPLLDREAVARRFRATYDEQTRLRRGARAVPAALEEVDRLLADWAGAGR